MANLISAKHPHHLNSIRSIQNLRDYYYKKVLIPKKVFSYKDDGISCPVSLNTSKKQLGIKRNMNKPPMLNEEINRIFYNNLDVLNSFNYLLNVVQKDIKFFKITNMIYNPNKVLMIEFVKPNLNIVSYDRKIYNVIGLFDIENKKLVKNNIDDCFLEEFCEDVNNISNIEFFYKKSFILSDEDIDQVKSNFEDSLKKIVGIFDYKLEKSLLDYLLDESILSSEYVKLKYYFKKHIDVNNKLGIIATVVNRIFGETFKKVCLNNKNCEGFVFYDNEAKEYIKLVGNHIDFYVNSNFNNKVLKSPILPFVG